MASDVGAVVRVKCCRPGSRFVDLYADPGVGMVSVLPGVLQVVVRFDQLCHVVCTATMKPRPISAQSPNTRALALTGTDSKVPQPPTESPPARSPGSRRHQLWARLGLRGSSRALGA